VAAYTGIFADELIAARNAERRAQAFERFANPQGIYVGELDGEIVCVGVFVPSTQDDLPDYLSIQVFYVDPLYFRRSIGRQLMQYALDLAQAQNYPGALLHVVETNYRARAFYEACGFAPDGGANVWHGHVGLRYVRKL